MNRVVIKNTAAHQYAAKKWCLDNISLDSSSFVFGHWFCNNVAVKSNGDQVVTYFFKNESDALMFRLRWT